MSFAEISRIMQKNGRSKKEKLGIFLCKTKSFLDFLKFLVPLETRLQRFVPDAFNAIIICYISGFTLRYDGIVFPFLFFPSTHKPNNPRTLQ